MTRRLVHTDLRGIQGFVFGSPRLRDVVARSAVVRRVCDRGGGPLAEVARAAGVTVVSAAGGASVVLGEEDQGRDFAARYSRALLEECRDLDPVITAVPVPGRLPEALAGLALAAARGAGRWPGPVAVEGLGFTEVCAVSGSPAETVDPFAGEFEPVSGAVAAARRLVTTANRELETELLPPEAAVPVATRFPLRLEELGATRHERSLVGIVHLDLDGLGARLAQWQASVAAQPETQFLAAVELVERQIDELLTEVARRVAHRLAAAVERAGDGAGYRQGGRPEELQFELAGGSSPALPLRPVLLGGDDLTLLCDGRLSWSVAGAAIDALTDTAINPPPALSHLGLGWRQPLTAGVGIGITSLGYPFDRGYAVAARLCHRAKSYSARQARGGQPRQSTVDWHLGDVHEENLPDPGDSALTRRPYPAAEFQQLLRDYLDPAEPGSLRSSVAPPGVRPWTQRGGWLREVLPGALRQGPQAARQALADAGRQHGELGLPEELPPGSSWAGADTALLDALELLPRHLELSGRVAANVGVEQ